MKELVNTQYERTPASTQTLCPPATQAHDTIMMAVPQDMQQNGCASIENPTRRLHESTQRKTMTVGSASLLPPSTSACTRLPDTILEQYTCVTEAIVEPPAEPVAREWGPTTIVPDLSTDEGLREQTATW